MDREHHCKDCGFDLSRLDMTLLYAGRGVDGARRRIHCPICRGGPVHLAAERLVFPRDDAHWVRWREGGSTSTPAVLQIGRLRLKIDARVETLTAEQICFKSVPVFESAGRRVVPTLPVRPEYLDCLDDKQLDLAQRAPERFGKLVTEGSRVRYRCTIPLRGLQETEWPTVECDVLPAGSPSTMTGDLDDVAFRGVSLRVWPNLKQPVDAWRYYLASFIATSEEGLGLFQVPGRTVRARMHVLKSREQGFATYQDVALEPDTHPDGAHAPGLLHGATFAGRPSFVSLAFARNDGETVGGGLFALTPARTDVTSASEWSLGLDFGTTNTVVAVRKPDGTVECVTPEAHANRESATLLVIDGGAQTLERPLDLWPGGEWTGPQRDTLPSELAATQRWSDLASRERIEALAWGRDLGVPLRAARVPVPTEHLVTEFKWLRAVQKDKTALASQDVVEALQARYLEGALLMTLASLLAESTVVPRAVTVYYSYPLAFEEQDLRSLERAAIAAEQRLKALTGLDVKFVELMDEAQAACGSTTANKMFRVCADLGGGSLEVLVDDTWARLGKLGHQGLHPHVFSTSVFFGGSVFLRSLLASSDTERKSSCVLPAMSAYTRLASEVRKWESGRTLIESPDIIAEARKATATRRARAYMAAVVELIARVLAGVCLEHGRTREGSIDLSRNRLFTLGTVDGVRRWMLGTPSETGARRIEFSLVLLGNAWAFGDIVRDGKTSVEEMVAQRVRIRLLELLDATPLADEISDGAHSLRDALRDDLDPRVRMEVTSEPNAPGRRKTRVARGLLEAQDHAQAAHAFETRANGRHGVLGFDLLLADSARTIPWYRPFGAPARDRAELLDTDPMETVSPGVPGTVTLAMPAGSPAMVALAPSPPRTGMPPLGSLEGFIWMLSQQWPQVTALAQQSGVSLQEFASRQLWGQVLQASERARDTAEHWLAQQAWDAMSSALTPSSGEARWQELTAVATQRGVTVHALLAAQRWEELLAMLARSMPLTLGPLPPKAPFTPEG